jgi:Mg-chelatase subunit ChlD
MKEEDIFSEKGIEITRNSKNKMVTVSQEGIEIRKGGGPLSFELPITGFIYLVIDHSESMLYEEKLNRVKNGAVDFAEEAKNKGYLVGLIQFGSNAIHLCEPIKDISILKQYIKNDVAEGSTNMASGIKIARQKLSDKKGPRIIVIATDGMPDSQKAALSEAKQAKEKGIDIITIGTDDADKDFLEKIASQKNLGIKVAKERFRESIASAAKILPLLK